MRALTVEDIIPLHTFSGSYGSQFDISPDGRTLAHSLHGGESRTANHRYCLAGLEGAHRAQLGLTEIDTGATTWISAPGGVALFSPKWSPDGNRLALIGTNGVFVSPYLLDVTSGEIARLADRNLALDIRTETFAWIGTGELAFELLPERETPYGLDLWYRGPERAQEMWQRGWAGQEPSVSALGPDHFKNLGTHRGQVVVFDLQKGSLREHGNRALLRGAVCAFADRKEQCLLQVGEKSTDERLPAFARTVAKNEEHGIAIHAVREEDATRIYLSNADKVAVLLEVDTHLAEVTPGMRTVISSPDGTPVVGCILPPDAETGQPLPAVMWVDPNERLSNFDGPANHHNYPYFYNLQLIAAQGYAVLVPNIPFDFDAGTNPDLVGTLVTAVTAACDAAVTRGITEAGQIHAFGALKGGWAVQILLAETDLFRSGISVGGISNYTSYYGQFVPHFRHEDSLKERIGLNFELVEKWHHFSGPPSADPEPYIRRSPVFAADRIQAPLMLLHCEYSSVPMTQSEEMFTTLCRLGKEVEFVRYWGDDNGFLSPANIRDAWARIFGWLNRLSPVETRKVA